MQYFCTFFHVYFGIGLGLQWAQTLKSEPELISGIHHLQNISHFSGHLNFLNHCMNFILFIKLSSVIKHLIFNNNYFYFYFLDSVTQWHSSVGKQNQPMLPSGHKNFSVIGNPFVMTLRTFGKKKFTGKPKKSMDFFFVHLLFSVS